MIFYMVDDQQPFSQKNITIKNCRKCKTKINKSFTKMLTRAILVLSFIVSENKNRKKKMEDVLALLLENKRAIHR